MTRVHRLKTETFGFVAYHVLRGVCGSNRLSITGTEIIDQYFGQGHNIFAFWHSRLFYLVYYYACHIRTPKVSILISLSRDGDYGQALVGRLKQDAVRGSSSRGGMKAVRALVDRLTEGYNVALAPDGPRGPAFQVQEGVIRLAQVTGARIIPASYDASRKWTLGSWDRFILPKPLGRIHLAVGQPICVPQDTSNKELHSYSDRLQNALTDLDHLCAEHVRA